LDTDGDGIPDYMDKCPKTDAGKEVDSTGCSKIPVAKTTSEEEIVAQLDTVVYKKTKSDINYKFENEKMLRDLYFTDGNLFCFQVGAFRSVEKSSGIAEKLINSGHNAFVVKANPFNNEEIWYRIRIGFFNSLAEAKKYKKEFSNK